MKARLVSLALALALPTTALAGPSSAREDWKSTNAELVLEAGEKFAGAVFGLPACAQGERFLVTHVTVAPRVPGSFDQSPLGVLGRWQARVSMAKGIVGFGYRVGASLAVGGEGPQHAAVEVPGGAIPVGVAGYDDATQFSVSLIDGPAPADIAFSIHLSGSCGAPTQVVPADEQVAAPRRARR